MRVTSLYLEQFRSFVNSGRIEFGQINVLIGPNNSGKSSILRALHLLQAGCGEMFPDVRVGAKNAQVNIGLEDIPRESEWGRALDVAAPTIVEIQIGTANRRDGSFSMHGRVITGGSARLTQVPNMEPDHFIVPYLSRRKTSTYQEDVRSEYAMRINTDMSFLSARLSRLANPGFPDYERYSKTCKEILGFVVTAIPSTNGQRPGVYLPNRDTIPIELMGEGVPNIVALLADLALSEGKVFLIEEPENDLHPDALKALLNLILESSRSNQFVVSTHSNIVVRHLAAAPNSRLFSVDTEAGVLPPVARIRTIEPTVEARLSRLSEIL